VPKAFGISRFAYSSFVSKERGEGSVLLDFFVTFLIKQESFKNINLKRIKYLSS